MNKIILVHFKLNTLRIRNNSGLAWSHAERNRYIKNSKNVFCRPEVDETGSETRLNHEEQVRSPNFPCPTQISRKCSLTRDDTSSQLIETLSDLKVDNCFEPIENPPELSLATLSDTETPYKEKIESHPVNARDISIINPKSLDCNRNDPESLESLDYPLVDPEKSSESDRRDLSALEKSILTKMRVNDPTYWCTGVIRSIIAEVRADMLNADLSDNSIKSPSEISEEESEIESIPSPIDGDRNSSFERSRNARNDRKTRAVLEKDSSAETVIDRDEFFKRCTARKVDRQVSFADEHVVFEAASSDSEAASCCSSAKDAIASYPDSSEYPSGGGSDRYSYGSGHRQQSAARIPRDRVDVENRDPMEVMDHHQYHHGHHREASVKRGTFTRSLSNNETPADEKTGKSNISLP